LTNEDDTQSICVGVYGRFPQRRVQLPDHIGGVPWMMFRYSLCVHRQAVFHLIRKMIYYFVCRSLRVWEWEGILWHTSSASGPCIRCCSLERRTPCNSVPLRLTPSTCPVVRKRYVTGKTIRLAMAGAPHLRPVATATSVLETHEMRACKG
jgi:hypothetical protein